MWKNGYTIPIPQVFTDFPELWNIGFPTYGFSWRSDDDGLYFRVNDHVFFTSGNEDFEVDGRIVDPKTWELLVLLYRNVTSNNVSETLIEKLAKHTKCLNLTMKGNRLQYRSVLVNEKRLVYIGEDAVVKWLGSSLLSINNNVLVRRTRNDTVKEVYKNAPVVYVSDSSGTLFTTRGGVVLYMTNYDWDVSHSPNVLVDEKSKTIGFLSGDEKNAIDGESAECDADEWWCVKVCTRNEYEWYWKEFENGVLALFHPTFKRLTVVFTNGNYVTYNFENISKDLKEMIEIGEYYV